MIAPLIQLVIDAVILLLMMQFLAGSNSGLVRSLIASLLGAFGAAILTAVFTPVGPNAGLIAALLVAVGFGIAITLVYEVRLLSAIFIGIVFLIVRSCVYYLLLRLLVA